MSDDHVLCSIEGRFGLTYKDHAFLSR